MHLGQKIEKMELEPFSASTAPAEPVVERTPEPARVLDHYEREAVDALPAPSWPELHEFGATLETTDARFTTG